MIKALLLDADGVLFFHADKLFSERLAKEHGVDADKLEDFFTRIFPECLIGKRDLKAELSNHIEKWGWRGTVDDLLDYWFNYEHKVDQPLIDNIRALKQRGITSYVATNNERYRADWLFRSLNIDDSVFEKLFASGDLGYAKPDPRFFIFVMRDLISYRPDEILFWDDTAANVEAARSAGMAAELYVDYADFRKKIQNYV